MDTDRVQLINSICLNGHTETINMIIQNPLPIARQLAGDFITSYLYVQIAKKTQFIKKDDGPFTRIF